MISSLRIKLLIGFVLLGGILPACAKTEAPKEANASRLPKVTITQPKVEKVERIIDALGSLEAEDQLQVASQVAGVIQEVKFEEGQDVKQDAVLVILDPTNFKLTLANAQTTLAKTKAGLALAQSNYERNKDLYQKKFITEQTLQELATELEKAKADLAGAQVDCQIAEKALADSVIKAPVDPNDKNYNWEVQDKLVSIGEYVNPGKPLADLVNRTTIKLRFTIPEQYAKYLSTDKSVKFTVPALQNKEFSAKIFYIGPVATENTRAVIVKARRDNKDHFLRPGYSANVAFIAESKEKGLVIPRIALRFDVDNPYVWVVNDDTLHKQPVTSGVEEENTVEITSGISATDTIVLRSSSYLDNDTKIEIVNDK